VLRAKFDESPRKLEAVMRQHAVSTVALMRKHGWLASEEEFARLLIGRRYVTVDRLAGLLRHLEPDGPASLLLAYVSHDLRHDHEEQRPPPSSRRRRILEACCRWRD
jgi:hypothetical protein